LLLPGGVSAGFGTIWCSHNRQVRLDRKAVNCAHFRVADNIVGPGGRNIEQRVCTGTSYALCSGKNKSRKRAVRAGHSN